ncbi:Polyketide cyclase/dehydrase and lipid transport superfamily protein [Melia azedarach]|uniref:Polyketide cyclase/dehydrase and lipid transport superfamily protein n=1 Tax=Melia azedarach TaxID=155640 RepID=A0ACC1X449_MELAZ|nr:Polyketide cyclase/dehydrase and lipid transport superfamily protein [Melia azedarach]
MEKKRKIAQYRERLDKTLASPELTNKETVKTLLKNQLNSSLDGTGAFSENVVEKRTAEVFNFLDMLRSASVEDNEVRKSSEASHGQWKLKQDTEEVRVMYREGPQGTPFHSILVEGYIDAPLDVCLCVSWESALYRKWWPQYSFPPFKILICNCLQKVRIGEQISLVRVKVTWPLSSREAVVHYFVFEYFQDGLMVALLTTIDDLKSIERTTHGFSNEGIPEAKDVVRIELVGGFALQKVTEERSFFRTIAHMDMKLNFVPPSLINFISRQLIGDGFKLYQKAVTSVFSSEDYRKALEEPLYKRIREALYSTKESKEALIANELKNDACIPHEEHFIEGMPDGLNEVEQKVHNINDDSGYLHTDAQVTDRIVVGEIEEEEREENTHLDKENQGEIEEEECEEIADSSVEQALLTLEKTIYMVREYGFNSQSKPLFDLTDKKPTNVEVSAIKDSTSSEDRIHPDVEVSAKESTEKNIQESRKSTGIQDSRRAGSNSYVRDGNHNRIAPASPEQELSNPDENNQVTLSSSQNRTMEVSVFDQTIHESKQKNTDTNGIPENTINGDKKLGRQKKHRFCCFPSNST